MGFITPRSGVRVSPPLPNFSLGCNVYGYAATALPEAVAAFCRTSHIPPPASLRALCPSGVGCVQPSLTEVGSAEDRQAVGRLLQTRRPLAARSAEDGHHAGAEVRAHLPAGADDE